MDLAEKRSMIEIDIADNECNARVPSQVEAAPAVAADGSVGNVVGSLGDHTELKQTVARLQRQNAELEHTLRCRSDQLADANRELDAFSYAVSHDLRAPLRRIDEFSRLVQDEYGDRIDAQGQHYLRRIRVGAQRMDRLIHDVLGLSRVGRGAMNVELVDLSATAREIATQLRRTDPSRAVEFAIEPDMTAHGDVALMRVALHELLENAWKYTGKHPTARIEVGTCENGGTTAYFVRDDGAGFDMEHADKLFAPFRRLHNESEYEGTGIGLATVKRVVHRHGGHVWADAEPEKGATFYFTLDVADAVDPAVDRAD